MIVIKRMLKHKAVYWAPTGKSDGFGKPLVSPPVEISCRWAAAAEEYISAEGTRCLSTATVLSQTKMDVGGVLMLGTLDDVEDESVPKNNPGAFEIKSSLNLQDFKLRTTLEKALL